MQYFKLPLFILLTIASLNFFTACDDTEVEPIEEEMEFTDTLIVDTLAIEISGKMNDQPLAFGTQQYTNSENQYLRFTDFYFYLSEVELLKADGTATKVEEVILHNFKNPQTLTNIIEKGDYTQIRYNLGLTTELNESDPSTFEANHPLSDAQFMHWGWAAKYKYIKVEGKVDEEDISVLNNSFAYHTGDDGSDRSITQDLNVTIGENGEKLALEFQVDLDKVFAGVDMIEDNTSHAITPIAIQIHDNFVEAIEVVIK